MRQGWCNFPPIVHASINAVFIVLAELMWKYVCVCVVFFQTEGRQLPLEKIVLGNTSFQSSPQADWGQQAVKEQVITPVPLENWLVLFVNRDKSKAIEFINMMKKVTPAMGIQVRNV